MSRAIVNGVSAMCVTVVLALTASLTGPAAHGETTDGVMAAVAPVENAPATELPISPSDALEKAFDFAKTAYDTYQDCMANIEVGQPCLNSDGDNIRAALQELGIIQRKMESNQDELLERLGELDVSLNESRVESYLRDLRAVELDGTLAMRAWAALSDCVVAKSRTSAECTSFLDDGRTRTVPVATGIAENTQTFLFYADQLPRDLASTIATYTGTRGSGDRYSLSYALWRLAKVRLDTDADVRSSAIRKSQFTPFVTPKMAKDVNEYLDYYLDVFSLYGNVLETRALLMRDEAQKAGDSAKAASYQLEADRIGASIDRRILSTSADSVNGIKEVYHLTSLSPGDIMMANASGTGVIIYAGDRTLAGDRVMRSSDVSILGQGLKNFGTYSKLAAAQPSAFPSDNWYEVTASVMKLSCLETGAKGAYLDYTAIANVPQPFLVERKIPIDTEKVRMKLLDAKPDWNDKYAYSKGCVNRNYGILPPMILFGASLESNVRWPATFDWKVFDFPGYRPWGYGSFLDTPVAPSLNRVSEEQSGNKMVRWPEGFSPVMPAGY